MPYAKFKQKCFKCRNNYVTATRRSRYVICYDCQKEQLSKSIEDKKMKKFFDIPEELYQQSAFLRDIKIKYLEGVELTERQIEAFKGAVEKMQDKKKEESKEQTS